MGGWLLGAPIKKKYLCESLISVSYTHLRAHETVLDLVCRLLLEKNESIDKKLLRYLTIKVKKFDLETNYFATKDFKDSKETNI